MKLKTRELFAPLGITILVLILLEILVSAFFPIIGLSNYRLPFNILIVLFLGFKVQTPYLALIVLILQVFHSFFSIEGWAMGTFSGVVVCMIISYLREMIHLSTPPVTMIVTQIFQSVWFLLVTTLIYIKTSDLAFAIDKFWRFMGESVVISLLSPVLFALLEKIWRSPQGSSFGEEI